MSYVPISIVIILKFERVLCFWNYGKAGIFVYFKM